MATETKRAGRLAVAARTAAAVTVALVAAGVVIGLVFDAKFSAAGRDEFRLIAGAPLIAGLLASTAVGTILLVRRPAHPVGWLFAGLAVSISVSASTEAYGAYGLIVRPGSLPGAEVAAAIEGSMWVVWFVLLALLFSLTPDGRYLSSRWRLASRVLVGAGSTLVGMKLISPGPLEAPFTNFESPWAISSLELGPIRMLAAVLTSLGLIVAAASLVVRFRRAEGDERRRLKWMAIVAVPFPALVALGWAGARTDNAGLELIAAAGLVALLPIGAGLAVTRYRLYEVDQILSRSVTYLIVTGLVIGTYAAVVFVVARAVGQAVSRSPTAITVATLVAAAAARPLYAAVRDTIDRRFQRRRYEALRRVRSFVADPSRGKHIEEVLREALGDPSLRVAYWDRDRSGWVTQDGRPAVVDSDSFEVERGGRKVAVVASSCDDPVMLRAVLDDAAPELDNAGLRAAVAVQLEEVRASRERIAKAQIDERRRIERDLHDGAQQRLLGIAAQMQAALLNGQPDRLRVALELGVTESRNAVGELRALATGLHPTVLEDGGLGAALDDLATRLSVSVATNGPERRYPPIVEATMWFVACEAVANAVKHAGPTDIGVRLDHLGSEVRLVVEDHGAGGADPTGAGLRGLTDRVEAAGGRLNVTSVPAGGTRVEAVLPCE